MTVKIIVCRVGENPQVEEVASAWKACKTLLADDHDSDPTIQIVTLDDGVELYSDEDAEMKGLELNRLIDATSRIPSDVDKDSIPHQFAPPGEVGQFHIHGHFVLVRSKSGKEASLTDDDVATWLFNLTLPTPAAG